MEKVAVDVRKLQLLNERVNQTIDALNQVRMASQQMGMGMGLSHTGAYPYGPFPIGAIGPQAFGQQIPFQGLQGQIPFQGLGVSQQYPQVGGGIGLGHSTFGRPTTAAEFLLGAFDPWTRQADLARAVEANRIWEVQQGLSHTSGLPYGGVPYGGIGQQQLGGIGQQQLGGIGGHSPYGVGGMGGVSQFGNVGFSPYGVG